MGRGKGEGGKKGREMEDEMWGRRRMRGGRSKVREGR